MCNVDGTNNDSIGRLLFVNSLPSMLFNLRNWAVGESSSLWLYCVVNSIDPNLIVTWSRNNVPLVQDVPLILIRKYVTTNSTILALVLVSINQLYNGVYQCTAQRQIFFDNGLSLTLTGMHNSMS